MQALYTAWWHARVGTTHTHTHARARTRYTLTPGSFSGVRHFKKTFFFFFLHRRKVSTHKNLLCCHKREETGENSPPLAFVQKYTPGNYHTRSTSIRQSQCPLASLSQSFSPGSKLQGTLQVQEKDLVRSSSSSSTDERLRERESERTRAQLNTPFLTQHPGLEKNTHTAKETTRIALSH